MIVVTAAMIAVAVGRDSQRVVLLALAGGFLTPLLVSTGKDEQLALFTYLAVLAAGLLLLARARDWYLLAPVSFFATQVFFWGWYKTFYRPEKLLRTSLFATLFFLIFAAQPVIRSRREGRLAISEMAVVLLNALAYLLASALSTATAISLFATLSSRPMRRSEEHTSELPSPLHLACRLLLAQTKS